MGSIFRSIRRPGRSMRPYGRGGWSGTRGTLSSESVDRHGLAKMRVEEGPPGGRRPRGRPTTHVLRHGQFGDGITEEREFGPNAAPAPRRIVPSHAMDQVAKRGVELRAAARVWHGFPSPVEPEALAVPGEDGRGLNDDKTRAPTGLQA
jgi:hypothetical protein